jgi:hypothetical protein
MLLELHLLLLELLSTFLEKNQFMLGDLENIFQQEQTMIKYEDILEEVKLLTQQEVEVQQK